MLQRTILRQGRQTCLRLRPTSIRTPITWPFLQASYAKSPILAHQTAWPRWYSESAEQRKQEKKPDDGKEPAKEEASASEAAPATEEPATTTKETSEEDALKKELASKNEEIIDLKDKYLRSVAEYRNMQERTRREVQSAKDFAIQKFAKDLIDSIDNLERALGTVEVKEVSNIKETNKPLYALYDGLVMTERILMQTLAKHGLERFDPSEKGEKFNPSLHEAILQAPIKDKEEGSCFHTQQKGFTLNGRVLRAAKVGVVKNS